MKNATYNTLYTKSNVASVIIRVNECLHGAIPGKNPNRDRRGH